MKTDKEKYLRLLSEKYPSVQALSREIINLNAILNLPKGTEHFMSDLHGEYEAFCHILNNCSGVIREKIDEMFEGTLHEKEREELCTLIYYPAQKLELLKEKGKVNDEWYRMILSRLIALAKRLSSKYTRSKVRKAMPEEFAYIIDELLHLQKDMYNNQEIYHRKIIDTILEIDEADEFIDALAGLIKRLALDHLHIVGDIFDRGPYPDKILDILMTHHSLDMQWGNHDVLWMGAAAGSRLCVASALRNNIKYGNTQVLENSYGICLRPLLLYAQKCYPGKPALDALFFSISIIMFKLEGQFIRRNPDFQMEDRLLLDKIDEKNAQIEIDGKYYPLDMDCFPTVDFCSPYTLNEDENTLIETLTMEFTCSKRLHEHIDFIYQKGSMYEVYNNNLLYHGCIPLDDAGNMRGVCFDGVTYKGKAYLDYADMRARRAFYEGNKQEDLDFMWFLWCARLSPLSGRTMKTFERTFIKDKETWKEPIDSYYQFYNSAKTCHMILHEFGIYSDIAHIINGHTPVKKSSGETPIKGEGKLLVIDGGFSSSFHKTTGIAGYTLIFNSHGMRIKSHQPFLSVYAALSENKDIESVSEIVETQPQRLMVRDTDVGRRIKEEIEDLKELLKKYREAGI